jgi:AbrB family looped-hinge helix DNA binding protein
MFDSIKFYGSATIGSKGQIVIPADAREELHMDEGEKVIVLRDPGGGGLIILKASQLEHMLTEMQTKFGIWAEAVNKKEGNK